MGQRIALVGPFHPYRGGIAHFLETMYHGLQARGHEVAAFTFTRQYPALLFPGKTQYETGEVTNPVPATRLLDTINPFTWRKTARAVAHWQPDVVVFKYWMPFFAPGFGTIARQARKHGSHVIPVVDNALPHERRPGDVTLSRWFLRACDGCIAMSASVEEDIRSLGITAPIRRVRHPIYNLFGEAMPKAAARTALGLVPPDAPTLLFFGFIRRYKGLHVLLDALPAVIQKLPQVRLIVAGEFYGDEAEYRAQVTRLGIAEQVAFHADYIPNEDVPAYFSAADVVVQPYVTATQSGVAQIAYQFERPTIVTDVGGLAEIVPHERAGLVVPPENPAALAAAIVRFFEENLASRLEEGVRSEKATYSWDHLYEALEALSV